MVAEGRPDRLDGAQEIAGLDDDLVLIAGAVARPLAERQIVGMLRPRQDFGEPARRLRPLGAVEPDGVLILLVEADRRPSCRWIS
jgi:hypothetical protein